MAETEYREEPGKLLDVRGVGFLTGLADLAVMVDHNQKRADVKSGTSRIGSAVLGRDNKVLIKTATMEVGNFIDSVLRNIISAQRRIGRVISNSSVHVGTTYTSLPGYPLKRKARVLTLHDRKRIAISAVVEGEEQ